MPKETAGAELLLNIFSTRADEMGEEGGAGENWIVDPTASWICCTAAACEIASARAASGAGTRDVYGGSW